MGAILEDPDLRARAVFAPDVGVYEVVRRAVEFLCAIFDAHVSEHVVIDATPVLMPGLYDEHVVAEVVQRVGGIEASRSGPDDHDIVIRRGFDGAR